MNLDKYAMLKAILPQKEFVGVAMLKSELKLTSGEAQEMISHLVQEGLVEPYPMDGLHFKVRKF